LIFGQKFENFGNIKGDFHQKNKNEGTNKFDLIKGIIFS